MTIRTLASAACTFFAVTAAAWEPGASTTRADDLKSLGGEWLYVEDRTEGRPVEEQGPPMSPRLTFRIDEDAFVWVRPSGDERVPFDGSIDEVAEAKSTTRRSGEWKDGTFHYRSETVRSSDGSTTLVIQREFRPTAEGMLLRVSIGDTDEPGSLALYRHPKDIELPAPAVAEIDDMDWLEGAWFSNGAKSSTDERWTPPKGGAMLGLSRTVRRGKMSSFEYLRIVEKNGGLVYIAQPGGRPPTEFVLTEKETTRAVFVNPRHDYPQKIVYELTDEGGLRAWIGFAKGGRGRAFEFSDEGE